MDIRDFKGVPEPRKQALFIEGLLWAMEHREIATRDLGIVQERKITFALISLLEQLGHVITVHRPNVVEGEPSLIVDEEPLESEAILRSVT